MPMLWTQRAASAPAKSKSTNTAAALVPARPNGRSKVGKARGSRAKTTGKVLAAPLPAAGRGEGNLDAAVPPERGAVGGAAQHQHTYSAAPPRPAPPARGGRRTWARGQAPLTRGRASLPTRRSEARDERGGASRCITPCAHGRRVLRPPPRESAGGQGRPHQRPIEGAVQHARLSPPRLQEGGARQRGAGPLNPGRSGARASVA